MERIIILKNTVTGQELTMPVTPQTYPMASGRAVERIDMAQTGQIALPGLKTLMSERLEVMFPAKLYPFCTAGSVADPTYYLELLTGWSMAGDVCRYIVVGAGVNIPVLLGPLSHREQDGTNDVYVTIPLYEYRYLTEVKVEQTQNSARAVEPSTRPATGETYVVAPGDTLWAISQKFYGDGTKYKKLAEANGIANPNILSVGQVLKIPSASTLQSTSIPLKKRPAIPESTVSAKDSIRVSLGMEVRPAIM